MNNLFNSMMTPAGLGQFPKSYCHDEKEPCQLNAERLVAQRAQHSFGNRSLTALKECENVEITQHICDGVEYTYVSPILPNEGLEFLAASIRAKDLNIVRIAVVCEQENEAAQLMKELGKRGLGCMLLKEFSQLMETCLGLWCTGVINSVLILSDAILPKLPRCPLGVNFMVHSTQPLPHVFQRRIQLLIPNPGTGTQVLVIKSLTGISKTQSPSPAPVEAISARIPNPIPLQRHASPLPDQKRQATPASSSSSESLMTNTENKTKSEQQDSTRAYVYNLFDIFAWSRREQTSCYKSDDVTAIDSTIRIAMQWIEIGKRAKRVQRFAWPHAADGGSLLVVGNESTGKTWCYLPALCQHVQQNLPKRKSEKGDYGPCAIIVCTNLEEGEKLGNWCTKLLNMSSPDMQQVVTFFNQTISFITERLNRPCGILITTVDQLLKLIKIHANQWTIFKLDAIKCIALDGIDNIWRDSQALCMELFKWLWDIQYTEKHQNQLFVVGRHWIENIMRRMVNELPDILLIFDDALEATEFLPVYLELTHSTEEYDQHILSLLREKQDQHVVIACRRKESAAKLSKLLHANEMGNIVVDKADQKTNKLCSEWSMDRQPDFLVVTDDVVRKLRLSNVDCLFHNGFGSWGRFKHRFSLFYGNWRNYNFMKGSSTVIVRPDDHEQIWLLCDYMLKHCYYPPNDYIPMLTNYRLKMEMKQPRSNMPLCHQIKSYGDCTRCVCKYRHILWDFETGPVENHPGKGKISFHVISSVSPAQTAIIFEKNKICKYQSNIPLTKFGEKVQLHYEHLMNPAKHSNPEEGDVCVVNLNKVYQRVGITRLEDHKFVVVKQLDAGIEFHTVSRSALLSCDEQFKEEPFQAFDLRVAGLAPFNMERIWSAYDKNLVRNEFFSRQNPECVYTATVEFTFQDIIFVRDVVDSNLKSLTTFVRKKIFAYACGDVETRLKRCVSIAKSPQLENQ